MQTLLGYKEAVVELNLPPLKVNTKAEDNDLSILRKDSSLNKGTGAKLRKSLELASIEWKESWKVRGGA